jgi:probable F420-dependent oxidoreductase
VTDAPSTTPGRNVPVRHGITAPLPGPLHLQRDRHIQIADQGWSDLWSAEADGADAFTPLAMAAAWEPRLRLGTAIVPAYTRAPALLAQTVATMAAAAPGRFMLGIGSSSNVIVERWNGLSFDQPYQRVRDTVRFLRSALTGEKMTGEWTGFRTSGFKLGMVPEVQPKIMVAALREGMLKMAGREGDGVIINWLSATDVLRVAPIVTAENPDAEVVARLFVCPSTDADAVRAAGRFAIAAYLNVPVYAEFHRWMGRGDALAGMWEAWQAGDRKAALAAISDDTVDELIVHGDIATCRAKIDSYIANGVTTTSIALLPLAPFDHWDAIAGLSPSAGS